MLPIKLSYYRAVGLAIGFHPLSLCSSYFFYFCVACLKFRSWSRRVACEYTNRTVKKLYSTLLWHYDTNGSMEVVAQQDLWLVLDQWDL